MYFRIILLLFLSGFLETVHGQDIVNFTQFFFNPYSLNPSYLGIDGKPSLTLSYRKQWATIEGGPTIANLSLQSPVSKRVAIGLNVHQDARGLLSNSGLLLSLGYNIPLAERSFVRFGISGGATWNKIDMVKLEGFSDEALTKILNSNTYLLGNAGISFNLKSFHVGASLPLLFKPAYVSQDAFTVTEVKPFEAFVVHLSNRFYFNNNKHVFEPYLLYRVNTGLPSQFELAGVMHLNHIVYLGGSYKQDFGISALGGIKLKNTFAFGASYSIKNSGINELNSPTYEVHLGFLFGRHKKGSPVYSFINTVKGKEKKSLYKSTSEVIAAKRQQDEIARKRKTQEDAQKNKVGKPTVAADKTPEKSGKLPTSQTAAKQTIRTDSIQLKHKPRFNTENATYEMLSIQTTEHTPGDEKERLERLTLYAKNPNQLHTESKVPNGDRHEYGRRGKHQKELNVGNYVVGGIFKGEENARHFSDGLKKLRFKAAYGYSTEKGVWYVYVFNAEDIHTTRDERDRLRKTKILRDSWLLTVQK
ncbi:MAG TPA: PorP/SprF family type IX secretion system membrane protein [Chryseolinea sp.]|nr:PorP/SprF family type IX secretion system membrane protein [Chryseolinea sp.]